MPILQIEIDASELERFIDSALLGLEQVEIAMDEELARGLYMARDLAQVYVPVDTGRLRDSIRVEGGNGSYTFIADAKNPDTGMGYASFVEFGCFFAQKGAKILTKQGWKSWEHIQVGDEVFTHEHRWKKVLEKVHYLVPHSPTKVTIKTDRSCLTVTENHPIRVLLPSGVEVWKPAGDIVVGDQILCVFNERTCAICGKPLKLHQKVACSTQCKNKYFTLHKGKRHFKDFSPDIQARCRKKLSEKMTSWWAKMTPEERRAVAKKAVKARRSYKGEQNPNYGKRYKLNLTPERRQQYSERVKGRKNPMYKYPRYGEYYSNYGFREDLGHVCRSSWEANFCRLLKFKNIDYDYEPTTFSFSDGSSYTPDIRINGPTPFYIEIKGNIDDGFKTKMHKFLTEYPAIPIQIIDDKIYKDIENRWSKKIKPWEFGGFKTFDPENLHTKVCTVTNVKKTLLGRPGNKLKNLYDLVVEGDHSYVINNIVTHNTSRQVAQPFIYPAISEVMPSIKENILGRIALTILGREYIARAGRVYEIARGPTGRFVKWYGER
jgi:intein/homing endonuclease